MTPVTHGKHACAQAKEMLDHLEGVLSNEPVEVVMGAQIVEVKPTGVSKGGVVERIMRSVTSASCPWVCRLGRSRQAASVSWVPRSCRSCAWRLHGRCGQAHIMRSVTNAFCLWM